MLYIYPTLLFLSHSNPHSAWKCLNTHLHNKIYYHSQNVQNNEAIQASIPKKNLPNSQTLPYNCIKQIPTFFLGMEVKITRKTVCYWPRNFADITFELCPSSSFWTRASHALHERGEDSIALLFYFYFVFLLQTSEHAKDPAESRKTEGIPLTRLALRQYRVYRLGDMAS